MGIQIYISKKNFDVQKAQRFIKERRIKVQEVDLKKHVPGDRELQVMAGAGGIRSLLDLDDKKVQEHSAAHNSDPGYIQEAVKEQPWLLKSPIVRCGNRVTVGYCPDVWETWIREGKA